MNFLCIYLGEKRGGCTNACICMGTHSQPFTTEPLNGCLRNLVGMKCLWSLTSVVFWPDLSRADPGRGNNRSRGVPFFKKLLLQTGRLQRTNRMHSSNLEACGKKCYYFWFHSEVKFLTRFDVFFGLSSFCLILMQFLWIYMQ